MEAWADFFNSQQATAATLAGLIFVGLTLNLEKILSSPALPDRAAQALIQFIVVLLISMTQLIPEQTLQSFGRQVLQFSLISSALILYLDIRMIRLSEPAFRRTNILNLVLNIPPMVLFVLGGIQLLADDISGMDFLVSAFTWCYIKAVIDAWTLTVEINR